MSDEKARKAFEKLINESDYLSLNAPINAAWVCFQAGASFQRRQRFEPEGLNDRALDLALDAGELAYNDTEGDLQQAIKEAVQMYADSIAEIAIGKFEEWYLGQSVLNTVDKAPSGLTASPDDIYCKPATRRAWAAWRAVIAIVKNGGESD